MFTKDQLLKQFELQDNDAKDDTENIKRKNDIIKDQPKIQKIKVTWYLGNDNINGFRLK